MGYTWVLWSIVTRGRSREIHHRQNGDNLSEIFVWWQDALSLEFLLTAT